MSNPIKEGVSIIIPTYNEEKYIIETLENIQKKVKVNKEIIIVDDSNDKTEEIVKKYVKSHKGVFFIKNKVQDKGFVKSLYLGIKKASKDVVVSIMGDMCDDPQTINLMYEKFLEGFDVVCASRYMKRGKRVGGPEVLGRLSKLLCLLSFLLIRVPTHDTTNSFKMYNKAILKKLKFNFYAGTAVSMELLYQAYFKNMRITELPTIWKGRLETCFKLRQRGPKYLKIFTWGLENKLRGALGLDLARFYISNN